MRQCGKRVQQARLEEYSPGDSFPKLDDFNSGVSRMSEVLQHVHTLWTVFAGGKQGREEYSK